jgi:all-trans-retinol dehydrogenase (NAD+)
MPRSLLPREGLTVEALFAPIRLTLLQPFLIGPLLIGLHRYPTFAAKWLPPNVLEVVRSTHLLKGLGIIFGIGLLRKINNKLSQLVLNNFTKDTSWDWSKEIVVVTGGSGGIGACILRMFADKNIKVISLDVSAPPTSAKSSSHLSSSIHEHS